MILGLLYITPCMRHETRVDILARKLQDAVGYDRV